MNRPFLERLSWFAGILSAIVAVVGLLIAFWPSKQEAKTDQLLVNTGAGTVVGVATGPITINQSPINTETESLAIKGRWSDESAAAIAKQDLKRAEDRFKSELCSGLIVPLEKCRIKHTPIGRYSLVYNSKEVTLLLWASIEDDDLPCHACSPLISIFEFERRPEGWRHSQSDVGVFQWGSWGGMDAANVTARPIGPNTFGIVFDLGVTQGGYAEYVFAVWSKLSDTYQKILHLPSAISDSGTEHPGRDSWSSEVSYLKADAGLFPIQIKTSGMIDGKRISTVTIFEFNGVEYVASNRPDHLAPIDCIKKNFEGRCR